MLDSQPRCDHANAPLCKTLLHKNAHVKKKQTKLPTCTARHLRQGVDMFKIDTPRPWNKVMPRDLTKTAKTVPTHRLNAQTHIYQQQQQATWVLAYVVCLGQPCQSSHTRKSQSKHALSVIDIASRRPSSCPALSRPANAQPRARDVVRVS